MERSEERHSQPVLLQASINRSLWVVIAGTGLIRAGGASIGLMLQAYEANIGVSPELVGLIGVAFYLTELVGAPLFGSWSDRRGWRPFMLLGPLLAALAVLLTWGTALLPAALLLPVLFGTRLLEGVAVASNTPATLSFIAAAAGDDPAQRARTVSGFELAAIGGTALGGLLGGVLYATLGVAAFGALAIWYLLCWAVFLNVPARLPGQQPPTVHSNPLLLLKNRALWSFAPAWIALNAILGLWLNNFANQLTLPCSAPPAAAAATITELCNRLGGQLLVGDYGSTTAGAIFTAFALTFSGGIVVWSLLLPRMPQSRAMLIALWGALVMCGLLYGLNQLRADQIGLIGLVCVLLAASLVVLSGFTPAALSILIGLAERSAGERGAIMGAYSVLLGLGQFIGGALGGVFAAWAGVNGLVLLTLLCTIVAMGFVLAYRRSEAQ